MQLQVGALQRVAQGLKTQMVLKLQNIIVDGEWAVVELAAENAIAKQGWVFDNKYCWICRFDKVHCIGLSSAMLQARGHLKQPELCKQGFELAAGCNRGSKGIPGLGNCGSSDHLVLSQRGPE